MKKIFLCICVVFSIQVTVHADQLRHGGVSGGGGNVIDPREPDRYLDPEEAEGIVESSHSIFYKYIVNKKKMFHSNQLNQTQSEVFRPVFEAPRDIIETIHKVRVHVEDDHSCWDAQKRPVDGSIFSKKDNSICISAFNLAQKAHVEDIPHQSAALMLHEYSELVGLSEEEAVQVQVEALSDLRELE